MKHFLTISTLTAALLLSGSAQAMTESLSLPPSPVLQSPHMVKPSLPNTPTPPAYLLDPTLPRPPGPTFDDHSLDHSDQNQLLKALRKKGILLTPIKVPGINEVTDLNNKGQVVGSYNLKEDGRRNFFIWKKGVFKKTTVSLPSETRGATIKALNSQGRIVGDALMLSDERRPDDSFYYVFSSQNGITENWGEGQVYGLNDQGQAVGDREGSIILWNNGVAQELGFRGIASSINNAGKIVGRYTDTRNKISAVSVDKSFVWTNGKLQQLNFYEAMSINNNDEVVGDARVTATRNNLSDEQLAELGIWGGARHPLYWKNGEMVDLNDLLPANSSVELLKAIKINDRHQIVVMGIKGAAQEKVFYLLTLLP